MNLSRAKTILICAFLGLNLLLCYHLFGEEMGRLTRVAVSAAELRRAVRQLEEAGYLLEAKIDRSARKSAFLTVFPYHEAGEMLRAKFAPAAAPQAWTAGTRVYESGEAQVELPPTGLGRVEFKAGRELAGNQEPVAAVELQLKEWGLLYPEARFDYLEGSGERGVVHYVQLCRDMPLYSGYLKAFLENNRLWAVEIYWLQADEPLPEKVMEVIPATEALLQMAEHLGPSPHPRRIVKAELGFYSRDYDAEKWEVPPVWRFLFEDGESCFVNAFTGNLES